MTSESLSSALCNFCPTNQQPSGEEGEGRGGSCVPLLLPPSCLRLLRLLEWLPLWLLPGSFPAAGTRVQGFWFWSWNLSWAEQEKLQVTSRAPPTSTDCPIGSRSMSTVRPRLLPMSLPPAERRRAAESQQLDKKPAETSGGTFGIWTTVLFMGFIDQFKKKQTILIYTIINFLVWHLKVKQIVLFLSKIILKI